MKLSKNETFILMQLASGDWISADWVKSSRGGFYLARSGENVNKRTYRSLKEKGLIAGISLTRKGKKEAKIIKHKSISK